MVKIIAEVGINHNGDINTAAELIRKAKLGGADLVKFQLYSSKKLFGDNSREKFELSHEDVIRLNEICIDYEIEFFASVFDEDRLQWCEDIGVSRYKIASRTYKSDLALTRKIINTKKMTYISLGMVERKDHDYIVKPNVIYFNCISKYPTYLHDIKSEDFQYNDIIQGWSDHCLGIAHSLYAISKGAQYIEKHFTLNKSDTTHRDHVLSMDYDELRVLTTCGRELWILKNKNL